MKKWQNWDSIPKMWIFYHQRNEKWTEDNKMKDWLAEELEAKGNEEWNKRIIQEKNVFNHDEGDRESRVDCHLVLLDELNRNMSMTVVDCLDFEWSLNFE